MKKTNDEPMPAYLEVRKTLLEIQKISGAMIKPFALYDIVEAMRDQEEQKELSVSQIRAIVETYCALCNEFYLIYYFDKYPQESFFVSEERWKRYFISRQTRERAIQFLTKHGFITCEERPSVENASMLKVYKIDLPMLKSCVEAAGLLYSLAKEKQRKNAH